VRENRRGIRERVWTANCGVAGRKGTCEREEVADEESGADAVGGPRRCRVNTEAPRRFTMPRHLGRCLTYPRLSGTQAIFTAGRVTTTRATSARRRDALREAPSARATETSFGIANTFSNTGRNNLVSLRLMGDILRAGRRIVYDNEICHARTFIILLNLNL